MEMRALYVTGAKGSGHSGFEKFANNVYSELRKTSGLHISELGVSSPVNFPFQSHALELGVLPLKVRASHAGDIVHASHQGLAHVLLPLKRRRVATCLDVIPFVFRHDYGGSWLKDRLLWLMRKGLLAADELVTISNFNKGEIEKHLGYPRSKVTVSYPAVDHSVFKPGKKEAQGNGKTVLYVGSEQPRKNLGVLLEAFAYAKKHQPGLKLVKVGRPQWHNGRQAFLHKAHSLGVQDDVRIIESASERQLAQIYRNADVFVFPSLYEGFGIPPLEAMACGTPVVCSNAASLPEVVGGAAVKLPPHGAKAFGEAIVKVLQQERFARQLRRKGLAQAKKFTWKKSARQVYKAYEKVW